MAQSAGIFRRPSALRLRKLEHRLGDRFLRVHRGALINVKHVQRLDRAPGGELVVVLPSGTRVDLSRARCAGVLRKLNVRG